VTVDVLAIGAHPDDVDLGVGGLVRKLHERGHRVGILDLTRGEMGSRGTVEERDVEAQQAGNILGAVVRENAGLPDGGLADTEAQRAVLIPLLRRFRPRILIAPMSEDRHPDHHAAHELVRAANYYAGLAKVEAKGEPHRAETLYYYRVYGDAAPALVVDISEQFDTKLEALRAFASQLHNPAYEGPETYVASEAFWDSIRTKAAYWGGQFSVPYGEALYADGVVGVDLPPGI
jgi:bacillithiol biosynthesis deacetylase BshB1